MIDEVVFKISFYELNTDFIFRFKHPILQYF